MLPTLASLIGGLLLWDLYWHFNELLGMRVPRWQLTANPALFGLTGVIFIIPFGTIAQRRNFKSRSERASCIGVICFGFLFLIIIALEAGFTPPLVSLPDSIVASIFILYSACAAFPVIRWFLKPDAKRLNPEPRVNKSISKVPRKKKVSHKLE
jgi:hypothetical protein